MKEEKRRPVFVERLTYMVIVIAGIGAMIILIDPVFTITLASGNAIKIGGAGFGESLKGAVVQTLLIGGWTTALGFWLRQTPAEERQKETLGRIAEASAPTSAAAAQASTSAVAAATGAQLPPVTPVAAAPEVNQPEKGNTP